VRAGSVHDILQFFAGFEVGDFLGGDFDSGSGFRIAPDAGLSLAGAKAAEASDLDLIASSERSDDTVKDGLDDNLGFFPGHFDYSGDLFNQIGFCHRKFLGWVSLKDSSLNQLGEI
jgi:hypothetical protein